MTGPAISFKVLILNVLWYARVDSNHRPFAPEAKWVHLSCLFPARFGRLTCVFAAHSALIVGVAGGALAGGLR
jgi:hypothetical protein